MGLAQIANKGYWQHFLFSLYIFVTFMPAPRVFFRRGPVFVLLIINFSYNQQLVF